MTVEIASVSSSVLLVSNRGLLVPGSRNTHFPLQGLLFCYGSMKQGYLTCSKTSFSGTVRYRGKTVKKYRRQPQMPIDDGFIELLNHKGFRGPVRKGYSDSYEIGERSFQTASNYLSYAIDLCSHHKKELRMVSKLMEYSIRSQKRSSSVSKLDTIWK